LGSVLNACYFNRSSSTGWGTGTNPDSRPVLMLGSVAVSISMTAISLSTYLLLYNQSRAMRSTTLVDGYACFSLAWHTQRGKNKGEDTTQLKHPFQEVITNDVLLGGKPIIKCTIDPLNYSEKSSFCSKKNQILLLLSFLFLNRGIFCSTRRVKIEIKNIFSTIFHLRNGWK
jgi:hypothetical protein